jgi:colanic acid biosynthesis glycosyl transferase WcaI
LSSKEYPNTKRILLISHNYAPEPTGIGKVNGEMMDWLAKKGHNCTVITTFPYYPYWKVQAPYKNRWYKKEVINYNKDANSITIYRCPSYVPVNPGKKRRVIQDMSFWTSMFWKVLQLIARREKFDLIITVAPPFHLAYLGLMLKKSSGAKLLYHIQDLQIEAAQNLNMLSNKGLFKHIYRIEKNIMTKADYVSGVSEGIINKIKTKIDKDVFLFPNWVNTDHFSSIPSDSRLKTIWGYKEDDIVFLYSGAIGEKQGLETILLTAQDFLNNDKIKFLICGSGPYKESLIQLAESMNLTNVDFLPVQEKELFNAFLNMADYHLIMQKNNVSDLVMPSKLTTIFAIGGVCIATSSPGTSVYNLINEYDLGFTIEPENHEALSNLIREIKPDKCLEIKKQNARNYAVKYLNIDNVMNDFLTKVFN